MYKYGKLEFEWDKLKARDNLAKHGVSFTEATSCFKDLNGFRLLDTKHSGVEKRYYWVGLSSEQRVLTVCVTYRRERIRIISAAEWRTFRRLYYERAQN